jgi:hypothetical protein
MAKLHGGNWKLNLLSTVDIAPATLITQASLNCVLERKQENSKKAELVGKKMWSE